MTNSPTQNADQRVIDPCKHMVNAVNGMADGSLRGPMRLYTSLHALHCARCRNAISALSTLHVRLAELERCEAAVRLSGERSKNIVDAMDSVDARNASSPGA